MNVIVITGGLGLLGREFTKTLLDDSSNIIYSLDIAEKVEQEYKNRNRWWKHDRNHIILGCDITQEAEIKAIINYIYNKEQQIDILINCAAINPQPIEGEFNDFETYSLDRWKQTIDVNLTGSFLISRECIKYMLRNKKEGFKGSIINIASELGIIASDQSIYEDKYKKPCDYGVSKAGIIYMTKYIAGYYEDKIKSICLTLGSVNNNQSEELKSKLEDRIPIRRLAKKNEYNGVIRFLCSDISDYMQGNNLIMDGGRGVW